MTNDDDKPVTRREFDKFEFRMLAWHEHHDLQHAQDVTERTRTRRWVVTTVITAAAAIGGLYALVVDVMLHVHALG